MGPMPVEAPVRETPTTAEPKVTVQWLPSYKVIVHNNDTNTFDEVIGVLMRAVPGLTLMGAIGFTYEIHLTGAAVVYVADLDEAEACANQIRAIGIKVTVEADT